MNKWLYISFILFTGIIAGWLGCKKTYEPKIVADDNNYPVVETVINTGGAVIGWEGSTRLCVDCTVRRTNVRPSFWTDFTQ